MPGAYAAPVTSSVSTADWTMAPAGMEEVSNSRMPRDSPKLPFAPAGRWLALLPQSGTTNVDWLVGAAEQLLLDAGLIGLPRGELSALLERRAAEAAYGAVSYRPFADEGGADGAAFQGLSAHTTFYDLLRGIHHGLGRAAREGYAALGFRPSQVRVNAAEATGPLSYECLAACLDAPVFTPGCETPAAAGAAMVAAVSLGQYRNVIDGQREWVEPRLRKVPRIDRRADVPSAAGTVAPEPT